MAVAFECGTRLPLFLQTEDGSHEDNRVSEDAGLALFALAGLACSAFFPLTIALASRRFEPNTAWVSSMLTAALMLGVGLGPFAVGALREAVSLENLYQLSALYPLLALALIALVLRRKQLFHENAFVGIGKRARFRDRFSDCLDR